MLAAQSNLELLVTLAGGLAAALAFGYVTHRLGLSPIVGYLIAGIVVGPHTPGFAANRELANQLAEVGVILLMFGVGLHFHIDDLLAVRRIAIPGAMVQSAVATLLGLIAAMLIGWGFAAGIVFGLSISVASTVVLTRVLVDNNDLHTPSGHIAIGWLVVEDILTVVVLVLLPTVFGAKELTLGGVATSLVWTAVKILALAFLTIVLGGRTIPWLLGHVAATHSRELFTLTVLVVALGIAVGSAVLFGVSMELGAFLAGMVVGRSDFSLRAGSEALPMRDAFAVLFFVSIGMQFQPHELIPHFWWILATLGIIMIGKPLAAIGIVLALRYPVRVAFSVAAALAQIGEFSFILASVGKDLKILPEAASNVLVAAAIISIALNPVLYRWVDTWEQRLVRWPKFWRWLNSRVRTGRSLGPTVDSEQEDRHTAIIVGYGPIGRTLCRLLQDNEIDPTVIEMNAETFKKIRRAGTAAVLGDALHPETLKAAHVEQADSLILSASKMRGEDEVIRIAREMNPLIRVLARTDYLREGPPLRKAGADRVFADEGEVALAMVEAILRFLGASPEQIDRERQRVREELFVGLITESADPDAESRQSKSDESVS
jgi:CPA2 family monovalent cation:H+ antiporter-2